jgi:hypothetical protein
MDAQTPLLTMLILISSHATHTAWETTGAISSCSRINTAGWFPWLVMRLPQVNKILTTRVKTHALANGTINAPCKNLSTTSHIQAMRISEKATSNNNARLQLRFSNADGLRLLRKTLTGCVTQVDGLTWEMHMAQILPISQIIGMSQEALLKIETDTVVNAKW